MLVDPEFADAFINEEDDEAFWKANVGFGRLQKRVEEVWRNLNASPEETATLKTHRAETARALSGAVHSSVSSAFRSYLVPSLRYPGLLRKASFGHIRIHSPALLLGMADQVHTFGVAILKLITSKSPPKLFNKAIALKELNSMFAAFLTLQAALERHGGVLPDFDAHFGDSTAQKPADDDEPPSGHGMEH